MFYVIRAGFSIYKNGLLYSGGQTIELSDFEFEQHKHKFENTAGSIFPSSPITQVSPNPNNSNTSVISISISANTWTDFGSVANIGSFQVLAGGNAPLQGASSTPASQAKIDLTDSFEYRQFQTKWQIFSLQAQNNLHIILNP